MESNEQPRLPANGVESGKCLEALIRTFNSLLKGWQKTGPSDLSKEELLLLLRHRFHQKPSGGSDFLSEAPRVC